MCSKSLLPRGFIAHPFFNHLILLDKKALTMSSQMLALIESPFDAQQSLLLDFGRETTCDWNSDRAIFDGNLVALIDAKAFIEEKALKPAADMRLICLTTIKKLIAKSIDQQPLMPQMSSADEVLRWFKTAISDALLRIQKLEMNALSALECQVIPATVAMQQRGMPFDKERWQIKLAEIESDVQQTKKKLSGYLTKEDGFLLFEPQPVDLNNANAVKEALEKILNKKLLSTSQSTLQEIDHEAAKLLMAYREQARMLNTYGEAFLAKIEGDRLKGRFVPIGSASGRFACHEPNLLALPNDEAFQSCLSPHAPYRLLRFDYGAFELRILASLSGDPALLAIFNDRKDIHSMVAEAVFSEKVSKSHNSHLRDRAKILNFGIIYGMGEQSLAKQLKVTKNEAATLLQSYFKRFSRVKEFLESLEGLAKNRGYVTTVLGRRLYLSLEEDIGRTMRVARNMPIQGTGADIVKLAMCGVFKRLEHENIDAHLINVVHDELVIECHEKDIEKVALLVKSEMERASEVILPNISAEINVKA